jgi:DHA2 family multidrug resistance protein
LLVENVQVNHADIAAYVTPTNRAFDNPVIAQHWSPWTAAGRAALDAQITNQATIIAYIDDFKFMMILAIAAMPLVLLLRRAAKPAEVDHSIVAD